MAIANSLAVEHIKGVAIAQLASYTSFVYDLALGVNFILYSW